jgi:hypothetical protein
MNSLPATLAINFCEDYHREHKEWPTIVAFTRSALTTLFQESGEDNRVGIINLDTLTIELKIRNHWHTFDLRMVKDEG